MSEQWLPPGSPRSRKGGCRRTLFVLALAVVGLALLQGGFQLFWNRLDQRRFPQGYASSGEPTLVGTWVGTMTTGGGARRGVLLDLRIRPLRFKSGSTRSRATSPGSVIRQSRGDNLRGTVTLCGGPNGEQRFTLDGHTTSDDWKLFRLGLSVADSVPPDGLAPSHMRGQWDGADALAMEADVYLRRGQSAISGTDDPDTGPAARLALRRGGEAEFRSACAGVRSRK